MRISPVLLAIGSLACRTVPVDSAPIAPSEQPPTIATATLSCAPDSGKWALNVGTERWTGGAELRMSTDGLYVEAHPVLSVEAAGDGSADRLELNITFVADFQDVSPGATTAFNCGTPALQGLITVFERDGKTPADCRFFGTDSALFASWDWETCTDSIEVSEGG